MTNRDKAQAALEVVNTILELIKSTGDAGLPSGHLYAMLMEHMDLEQYERLIDLLVETGRIKRSNNLLTYAKRS